MNDQITLNFEVLNTCPVCGSQDISPAYKDNYKGMGEIYQFFCADCHLIFLNPRMTDEQTAEYYAGMYRNTIEQTLMV